LYTPREIAVSSAQIIRTVKLRCRNSGKALAPITSPKENLAPLAPGGVAGRVKEYSANTKLATAVTVKMPGEADRPSQPTPSPATIQPTVPNTRM
jgi:hypothetical protein